MQGNYTSYVGALSLFYLILKEQGWHSGLGSSKVRFQASASYVAIISKFQFDLKCTDMFERVLLSSLVFHKFFLNSLENLALLHIQHC